VADLRAAWAALTGSLWFVPGSIVLVAILLAVGMIELSSVVDPSVLARWPRVFGAGAEGSRSMLAAIASSMITVAGVTFSITMVAVTQASSQYTPRILRNFMRDRANQVVLGVFVGIFAYCLVVLRTIRGQEEPTFVPSLAVLLGVLLALLGIAVLIFFVHHIATTLQASEITARVFRETVAAVAQVFPGTVADELGDPEPARLVALVPEGSWRPVLSRTTGYVQRIDLEGMTRVARKAGLLLRLECVAGEFTVAGLPAAWYAPHPSAAPRAGAAEDQGVNGKIPGFYVVSSYRTIDEDPAFGIRQLVDMALKAISPGINDTTTAITCVDYIGAILVHLARRRVEDPRRDEDGVVRVVAPRPTFEGLLALAYDEIRQSAGTNVSVLGRQLETLAQLGREVPVRSRRAAVSRQVELVQQATAAVPSPHDREHLDRAAREAREAAGWP